MFARLIAPAFASALALAAPAGAMDLTELTDAERAQFRAEVRAYLMENPEVILQAVEQMQNRQAEAQMQADFDLVTANADEIFDDGYSWVGGNPDGDITLVEFLDYRCGYCKRAHGEVAKLLETDGNIKLIVKEFPILGDQSMLASRFAVATKQVAGGDAYKQLNDALMAFNGEVSLPALRRLGESFDLDVPAIEAKMDSDEVIQEITQTRALAQKLQITGTPTFVMQDEMLRGYLPYDQMMALVDEKRG
ncbi:DsbA family protein [Sulfitobacter sp. W002]|jgi:protein-disulfide isomerase|uniref:DsbA family protein n=1 Tax=unclassified Sulfitobacter TaxID=196795 RepID=UPI0007C39F92|nr:MULTISPECIES: DsbA family protein [unclassified Sulfitobacter]KZX97637.1 disulfide bond formation protein DsbA [Sulfitobacter sp. HI0021]KZY01941.1 disulfide bond formation protein DsbA [Sulfitobacter sp. HI0027]KZY98681.1 disulfide bond formation protein DsbA [Sulfitobacter sp. HI0076]UWR28882.1 DsbA family protein [Sulfitobacter sp. W002]WPZ30678.1 DsbA family protein [Sulfitobacter sp. OXR-159]